MLVGRLAEVDAIVGARYVVRQNQHILPGDDAILAAPLVRGLRIGVRRAGDARWLQALLHIDDAVRDDGILGRICAEIGDGVNMFFYFVLFDTL